MIQRTMRQSTQRFETFNQYDVERGILRTIESLIDKLEKDSRRVQQVTDPERLRWLRLEIENTTAEITFLSSSLLFDNDLMFSMKRSQVFKTDKEV